MNTKTSVWILGAAVLGAGCSGGAVCTVCPDLHGSYQVTFGMDQSTGDCSSFGVDQTQATLNLTQNGASLTGQMLGFDLSGTLYATGRFVLNGDGEVGDGGTNDFASLTLQGTAPSADAGTITELSGEIQGDFSNSSGTTTDTCTLDKTFIAEK